MSKLLDYGQRVVAVTGWLPGMPPRPQVPDLTDHATQGAVLGWLRNRLADPNKLWGGRVEVHQEQTEFFVVVMPYHTTKGALEFEAIGWGVSEAEALCIAVEAAESMGNKRLLPHGDKGAPSMISIDAIQEASPDHQAKVRAWLACEAAGVPIPDMLAIYFNGVRPSNEVAEQTINLAKGNNISHECISVRGNGEYRIHVHELPANTTVLCVRLR